MEKTQLQKSHATVPLKGQAREIFYFSFLYQKVSTGPLIGTPG